MAPTRRKSKRTASSAAVDESESQDAQDDSMVQDAPTLTIAIPDDLPVDALSSLLPEFSLAAPSPDAILSLYRLVASQLADLEAASNDIEEARAQALRKEVELDSAVQDREATVRELETSLESVTAELSAAKHERDALQSSQAAMQSQLSSLNSTQTTSSSELDNLRRRVEDAESEKRSLMGVMDRMKEQDALRDDEVKTMRDRLKEARDEITELQSKLSETTASDNSNKFKIHTIEQELVLANSEREQLRADLTERIEERARYRREKDTQARELQAALDAASSEVASTRTALDALQTTHDGQARQLSIALAQVGELRGELAAKDAAFRAELANTKRMVAMLERRQEEARARVEEVDREWNDLTARAAQQEERLRREVERERARGDELEKQLDELRGVMAKMGEAAGEHDASNGNGFALSPTASLASKLQKSGRSYTEVYADYVRLQDELARQKHETRRLEDCLAQILADIEERAPLLQEQRLEYERVSAEARQLAEQLAAALEDRDSYAQRAQGAEQKNVAAQHERQLLEQQLTDLGRQVQALLREQRLRENPSLALAELDEPTAGRTDTDNLITQQLVVFRSIPELQEQNAKLLGITRELGARMELQEAEQRAREADEDSAMLREAEALVAEAHRELEETRKSAKVKIEAYSREIDMLKSMLAKTSGDRRALPAPGDASTALVLGSGVEYQSMYQEAQRTFDTYKLEIGEDNRRLKEDLLVAQREVGTVNAALAKANAKITTLEERVRLASDEKQAHLRAISELSKAKETLQANLARVENSYSEIVEKHSIASGQMETLRNQTVQLKAEREVLKGVEARLTAENKNLSSQRTHLTDLMQNLRKMQADLEKSEENDKRRLEGRAQVLESQVEDLRGQLNRERDLLRHAQFQKDSELRTLRERLDKATHDLGTTREQLVAAQTSQTHLQERVDDLSKQLQASHERLAVYERRPSAVNGAAALSTELPREQQLESEVAELRGLLKIAEVDLETARTNVEQFREISRASEAALEQVSNTYEQYKAQSEKELADKTAAVTGLEQKLAELQQELGAAATRTTELQATLEKERAAFADDKRTFEDTVMELTNSNSMSSTERQAHVDELRQQQERAQIAEEQYQREIVAHADAIKSLERTRDQLLQAQASARNHQTQAETAQAKLLASESSWSAQREMLDKQLSEMAARQQALNEQNELLHKHLETVSSQAARIRQAADVSVGEIDDAAAGSDPALAELRSVVLYLRKEKEIADLQLEINQQEIARLKADGERMSRELDEQKALLAEERERATNSLASAQQQAELVERINQLNVMRESNAMLRNDSQTLRKRVTQLEAQVQALTSELEPVKAEARDAKAELESRMQQIAQLERENSKWKERNQQILRKYDRTDPEELQRLKDEIDALRAEKQTVEAQRAEIETKANTYRNNLAGYKDRYETLTQQTRQNFSKLNSQVATQSEQIKALEGEKDALQKKLAEAQAVPAATPASTAEIDTLKAQIQALNAEKARLQAAHVAEKKALEEKLAAQPTTVTAEGDAGIAALRAERDALLAEKATWTTAAPATDDEKAAKVAELEAAQVQSTAALAKAKDDGRKMFAQNRDLNAKMLAAERASKELQTQIDALTGQKTALEEQLAGAQPGAAAGQSSSEVDALRTKIAELEKQLADQSLAAGGGQVAIDAAVAAAQDKFKAEHQAALQTATENAKAEVGMKLKLQETKLNRLTARLKQLSDKIVELGGTVPDPVSAAVPSTPAAASTSAAPPRTPVAHKPPAANGVQIAATALPAGRKPGLPPVPASAGLPAPPTAAAAPPATRGRGTGRGGRGGRGGAVQRGGGPAAAAAAAAASTSTPPTLTAAAPGAGSAPVTGTKRPREEGEQVADSLAKRLRGGGPVALQRNRPLPES